MTILSIKHGSWVHTNNAWYRADSDQAINATFVLPEDRCDGWVVLIDDAPWAVGLYLTESAAMDARDRMIESVRRDEEYRASPAYAARVKSMRSTDREVTEEIHRLMHEQGDLA